MNLRRIVALALSLLACASAQAIDYRWVGASPAVLYGAPSTRAAKQYIVPSGAPLEVVLTYGEWVKVRDMAGDLAWTEAKGLSLKQRNVIVRSANTKVRSGADDTAPVVFIADKGVLLELAEPAANGWTKVRHRDGLTGYVRSADIWGN
ncbi:SH3 domain-containing protein [Pseudoduganella violaceinigra]|uniref:SH3 domain-containing protein n=1 Tax=Pseudoduganella violaceinigra TaxID=246602 RepID=UPI00041A9023|nr:SH3 domain-containing protein [Pseudoduganella violaceinigra]